MYAYPHEFGVICDSVCVSRVRSAYPDQAKHVNTKEKDLKRAWDNLKAKADATKAQMEESHGQRILIAEAEDLVWNYLYCCDMLYLVCFLRNSPCPQCYCENILFRHDVVIGYYYQGRCKN